MLGQKALRGGIKAENTQNFRQLFFFRQIHAKIGLSRRKHRKEALLCYAAELSAHRQH